MALAILRNQILPQQSAHMTIACAFPLLRIWTQHFAPWPDHADPMALALLTTHQRIMRIQ
ncbi:hypothetical protein BD410DRAFT_793382 [Rickenella mellea]|uniref:Uncharacterized protein n=1 Tax=Rickenella mellea TaxID=50990 RepID=A0A4Y7PSE5_9AGAM|nr:hypothetical protein BD410DRAFT_793382 [Rickenella mellea]